MVSCWFNGSKESSIKIRRYKVCLEHYCKVDISFSGFIRLLVIIGQAYSWYVYLMSFILL